MRQDGSYPSGHSAIGWGTSLILSHLIPDKAHALLARGRDFGESRVVCNVHWLSDVELGQTLATATFFRLQSSPAFLTDLSLAKAEIENIQKAAVTP